MARALVTRTSLPDGHSAEHVEPHPDTSLANLPEWAPSDEEDSEDILSPTIGFIGLLALAGLIAAAVVVTLAIAAFCNSLVGELCKSGVTLPKYQRQITIITYKSERLEKGEYSTSHTKVQMRGTSVTTKLDEKDAAVIQSYGSLVPVRLGLAVQTRYQSIAGLNRLLAHSMAMRDLYKKSHWQTSGSTFYELHLLFDKHYTEQLELVDSLAERVQTLGGVALALAHDVAEESKISRAPRGRENVLAQLRRLLDGHETLAEARPLARQASEHGDDGTNDLIVSEIVRTNELQSWFVGAQLSARDGSP
jgi:starvation-inducible DNA-binding protein